MKITIEPARAAILAAFIATSLQMLDTTITVVALPYMQAGLRIDISQISWVLTAYLIGTAVILPLSGWLADRFGRRRAMITALAGFVASSIVCAVASDISVIVVARLLQGAFGAPLVSLSHALILDNTTPANRAKVTSRWAGIVMIAPILGPTIGGVIAEFLSWRWVFLVNVPLGLIAIWGIAFGHGRSVARRDARLDWPGFALFTVAVVALQLALDRGEIEGWFKSAAITSGFAISLIAGLGYLALHLRRRTNYVNREMMADDNYRNGLILMFFVGLFLYGPMFILPKFMDGLGYSVLSIGLLMAPRGLVSMAVMIWGGGPIAKMDVRLALATGFAAVAASLWLPTQIDAQAFPTAVLILVSSLQGVGFGILFIVTAILPFMTLKAELRAQGSGFNNLSRFIGGAIGVAFCQTLLSAMTNRTGMKTGASHAVQMAGFNTTFWILCGLGLLSAVAVVIFRPSYTPVSELAGEASQ